MISSHAARGVALAFAATSLLAQTYIPNSFGAAGANGQIEALSGTSNTDLIAAGSFTNIGGVAVNNIARFNGTSWAAMGAGVPTLVRKVLRLANGNIMALTAVNTASTFNGVAWAANPTLPFSARGLIQQPNGNIVGFGLYQAGVSPSSVVSLVGGGWTPLGTVVSGQVLDAVNLPNGNLLIAGNFALGAAQPRLATFNGTTWTPFAQTGIPTGFAEAARVLPTGEIVVAFRQASPQRWEIHRTNGTTWTRLAGNINAAVENITVLPNGTFAISGGFTSVNGVAAQSVARFTGTTWVQLATMNGLVRSMTFLAEGRLAIGGQFTTVNGIAQNRIGAFGPSTGSATIFGSGCSNATGASTRLAPTSSPIIGSQYSALATGMSAGFAVQIRGLTSFPAGIPLSTLIGGALPGCSLFASPDLLDTITPVAAGNLVVGFPIANDPALLGGILFHQVASFDALGQVSSSNGVQVVIGNF